MAGEFLERIARNKIMSLARIAPDVDNESITLPDPRDVSVKEAEGLLLVPRKPTAVGTASNVPSGRYARSAAPIGRRAEEIAQRFLLEHSEASGAKNIRWISQEGLTPGWDLQYENHDGEVIAVEVKGTTGPVFGSVDITTGEWNAAVAMADRYWLYLVANCCGTDPRVQPIQNPARLLSAGVAELTSVVYRFSLLDRS